jgi:hypothetical protein
MGTQGIVYKDLLPLPEVDPTVHEGRATTLLDAPTESHALAMEAAKATHPTEAGAAQVPHDEEVVDLGWNEPKELIARPLVGGLSNDDLWLLVRRFNKVSLFARTFEIALTERCSKCTMSKNSLLLHRVVWI